MPTIKEATKTLQNEMEYHLPSSKLITEIAFGYWGNYEEAIKSLEGCYVLAALKDLDAASQHKVLLYKILNRLLRDQQIDESSHRVISEAAAQVESVAYDEIMRLIETKCKCEVRRKLH